MMILNTEKRSQQDSDRIIWAFGFKERIKSTQVLGFVQQIFCNQGYK